jgi:hypothetical protein
MAKRIKPYGVRAIELDLGIQIPVDRIVDYAGPRMELACTPDHAQGSTPQNTCHCAGARMGETITGADRCSIVHSRAYAYDREKHLCTRYVAEGGVRKAVDENRSPIGLKLVLKAPKQSIKLGGSRDPRDRSEVQNPGSCPQRGRRGHNGRIETVRARERIEAEKLRRRKASRNG